MQELGSVDAIEEELEELRELRDSAAEMDRALGVSAGGEGEEDNAELLAELAALRQEASGRVRRCGSAERRRDGTEVSRFHW